MYLAPSDFTVGWLDNKRKMADNGGSSAVRDLTVPDRKRCMTRLQERELPEWMIVHFGLKKRTNIQLSHRNSLYRRQ